MNSDLCDRLAKAPALQRISVFISLLLLSWLPLAVPGYLWIPDANLASIMTLIALYGLFLGWLCAWGTQIDRKIFFWRQYGFWRPWQNTSEAIVGFGMAASCLLGLLICEGSWGWLDWQPINIQHLLPQILEGLLVGVAIGLAEELFFRGWLLAELRRDYDRRTCLLATSVIFAALHFVKPLPAILHTLPQFGGLVLLGMILVWARRSTRGRLGLSIGLHAGLVTSYYWVNVGDLIRYTGRVPEWVTGIHENPLAGVAGIGTLAWLAWMVRSLPQQYPKVFFNC
jgi:uncharacterized protein